MSTQSRIFDREALRPVIGDVVVYENVLYVVTQVGLKYLMAYRKDNPKVLGMLKRSLALKWFAPEVDEEYRGLDLVPKK